ncbi:MAG: aminotransferase class I/II-fold pyridoxal phosphate-dependent enzyme [Clostridiaceae bacterium]
MTKLPIIEAVGSFIRENNALFCTPGHKGGAGFKSTYTREFVEHILRFDITEVDGLDNLHDPEGIIKESEELLSRLYGSYKSFYLINGSTLGNLIMIFSTFNEGDKILIERNCHKSIYNAVIMRKLKPVFVKNKMSTRFNAPLSIDLDHFSEMIKEHKDIKGTVVTYPNYYGVCCDLKKIIEECKKSNIKVLVDSAHGAHFGIHPGLPENAVKSGADMVVSSAHKTLPSLTQTAYLHLGKEADLERVKFYFNSLSSTSPSYLFLCSLEFARFYLEEQGRDAYDKLIKLCEQFREKINMLEHVHIIGRNDIRNDLFDEDIYDMDPTRYIINVEKGYSGVMLLKYLRKSGIQAEMSDGSNVVLILSPFNSESDLNKLYAALKECSFEDLKAETHEAVICNIPDMKVLPHNVINEAKKKINFLKSAGRVCGDNIVPYPPGVPLLMMGEEISKKHIEIIKGFIDNGVKVIGISSDGQIAVLEDKA